jgi:GTP-binding protein
MASGRRRKGQMLIRNVNLETVCGVTSKLPENTLPEFAFAGKSNVGKSSLINGLMNRKSLARTSSSPGKTQTINYYNINNEMYFVDLPGYGYATANEKVKATWGKMIEDYLHQSKQIRAVFLLVDIRHAPSENDRIMYDWILDRGYQPVIIATKLDKIKRSQVAKQLKLICDTLDVADDTVVIPYSSLNKQGREEIYELLDKMAENTEL